MENPVFPKLAHSQWEYYHIFFLGQDVLIIKVIWKKKQAK